MYSKTQHYLWFQVSTEGLEMYQPWIRRDYCISKLGFYFWHELDYYVFFPKAVLLLLERAIFLFHSSQGGMGNKKIK